MRYLAIGVVLATASAAALAQDSAWGYYEPEGAPVQAGIAGEGGVQLILKCDKPGKHKVYAVVVTTRELAAARGASGYESGKVTLTFDGKAPIIDDWRFNGKFAMAMDDTNLRTMTRFAEQLVDAGKLELILEPRHLTGNVTVRFDVAGARDALVRVYDSCKDKAPFE